VIGLCGKSLSTSVGGSNRTAREGIGEHRFCRRAKHQIFGISSRNVPNLCTLTLSLGFWHRNLNFSDVNIDEVLKRELTSS
jgi:hypothetical protein